MGPSSLTFGYKENQTIFCFSQKKFLSGTHPNFSHTDTRRSFCSPHTDHGTNCPRGRRAWPGSQGEGQGAVTSSISAFSRDICHSHLGKLLSRSHSAQTADNTGTRTAKLSRAAQAIKLPCYGIQKMYILNFLSILSNTCLKFPCGTCQILLLQIAPPERQGKCRKLFQRCRKQILSAAK